MASLHPYLGQIRAGISLIYIASMIALLFLFWKICEAREKPRWWSLLMLIPFVNLAVFWFVALEE